MSKTAYLYIVPVTILEGRNYNYE